MKCLNFFYHEVTYSSYFLITFYSKQKKKLCDPIILPLYFLFFQMDHKAKHKNIDPPMVRSDI